METNNPIKITAIINPFSGLSNKLNVEQKLLKYFTEPEYLLTVAKTESAGHAISLSKTAVELQQEIVIAIGGDGTMNEVASSLINTPLRMGIISMGSGNGFARHLGVHNKLDKSLEIIKKGHTTIIDSCTVNGLPFINVGGMGFDAKIAYHTKLNKSRGLWPYIKESIKAIRNTKSLEATCCFDDKCVADSYKTIVVANASLYGFNFSIAPLASLMDGKLDIMLYKDEKIWKYLLELPKFITSRLHKSKLVDHYKCEELRITIDQPSYLHRDGEGSKIDAGEYVFKVIPRSLHVITDQDNKASI